MLGRLTRWGCGVLTVTGACVGANGCRDREPAVHSITLNTARTSATHERGQPAIDDLGLDGATVPPSGILRRNEADKVRA
jgi:hypothetical protein